MPRRRRAATLPVALSWGVLACAAAASPLHGQRGGVPAAPRADGLGLDLASGALGGTGVAAEGAFTLAPSARLTLGDALALRADLTTAFARSDLLRGRAAVAAEPAHALFGLLTPVVSLRAAQDRVAMFGPSARIDGEIALRLGGEAVGAWVGAGVARSRHMAALRDVRTLGAGVHLARGPLRLRASYDGDAFDVPGASREPGGAFLRTRLHDVSAEASFTHRRLAVGAFSGQRLGTHVAAGDRHWGGAWAQLPVTASLALTARHETTPSDPSRHLPMQRITALGVRLGGGERAASAPLRPVAAFALVAIDASRHVLRLRAPLAREVEVAGSFSAWEPRAMAPTRDGWWELVVSLPPGLHQLNWRTDGGAWRVPPGLEAMRDDYDGTVGVLVVGPR